MTPPGENHPTEMMLLHLVLRLIGHLVLYILLVVVISSVFWLTGFKYLSCLQICFLRIGKG